MRQKIVDDLKAEEKHTAIVFSVLTFGALIIMFIIGIISNFKFNVVSALAFGLFAAIALFLADGIVFCIVRMFRYGTDKLLIVEDKLYKTIPYEKIQRSASKSYTTYYEHGLYFKEYGKFTVTSTSFSIDFDGNSDYYLVVYNGKKPKILQLYRKNEYEYKQ